MDNERNLYGLVGRNISYSFSQGYFTEKFKSLQLDNYEYRNFHIEDISKLEQLITDNPDLKGLNVTIPYKEAVIPLLGSLSDKAARIGAVNTIRFTKKGKLKGYNTDWIGFKKSLQLMLQPHHKKALILGTGGASKAVAFALADLGILYTFVSREATENAIAYSRINATTFDNHQIIINCTPLGTSPNVTECPEIPYGFFTSKHIAFDLIYNPEETEFLKRAKSFGAATKNGYEMLVVQAEKAWQIWNKH
ncbi:MAG TPA: shikimate dehydrogenase [Flavobacterium sp.]